jgi:hypothetical protein
MKKNGKQERNFDATRKVSLSSLPYNGKILAKEERLWANNSAKDNLFYEEVVNCLSISFPTHSINLELKDFQIEWKWNMKGKKGDINSTLLVHIEARKGSNCAQ